MLPEQTPEEIALEAWDGDRWQGGLTARITQRWLFLHLLGVAPEARGQGVGTRLMQAIEEEARARSCLRVWLDTYSFQAPGFYARLGYEEVGRIPDYSPGHARIFLAKPGQLRARESTGQRCRRDATRAQAGAHRLVEQVCRGCGEPEHRHHRRRRKQAPVVIPSLAQDHLEGSCHEQHRRGVQDVDPERQPAQMIQGLGRRRRIGGGGERDQC
ncbi:GNAT family N-acetyltransferase [Rubellimicrobium rubrum]|uniref:GNAT family N-acetyltransferase n=1 Tax=Rubellimicrobium rubrum TaxID=2585369 RepID=A0A5C4MV64_9RHOB|nr:GNAT family N-acetyltransferase [Rubellimicrobium rubrum]